MKKNRKKYYIEDIKPLLRINDNIVGNEKNMYFTNVQTIYKTNSESLDWINSEKENKQQIFENSKAKIIIWGSSYSASLAIKLGGDNPTLINGVLAFSPGEYFDRSKTYIRDSAKKVKCPVFITSASKEAKAWKNIFLAIPSQSKHSFLPKTKGNHGSRALWNEFNDSKDYWQAVNKFLYQYFAAEPNWPHPRSDELI